jgi:hypothetical protein
MAADVEIHTLNARDSLLLSFVHGIADGDSRTVNKVIVGAANRLTTELRNIGVDYSALGPALTPRRNRRELGLIFEIGSIESSSYGPEMHNSVLPLLNKKESHSVLAGDLSGDQGRLAYWLALHMQPARPYQMAPAGTQLFCIYITNCSESAIQRYLDALAGFPAFIGVCDMTFGSEFRAYVADRVSPRYVQHHRFALQRKGDDEPLVASQNALGYDFERHGFVSASIQATYFDLLLGFKVERPPRVYDEPDQYFALNAVSNAPNDLADFEIEIEYAKFGYLTEAKDGTLARLGLRGYAKDKLESAIRSKIHSTYLYRLRFSAEYNCAGFTVLLELDALDSDQPVRVSAGFEYQEPRRTLRLVTLF